MEYLASEIAPEWPYHPEYHQKYHQRLSCIDSINLFGEETTGIWSCGALWPQSDSIIHRNRNSFDVRCTGSVIYFNYHLDQLTWLKAILSKGHDRSSEPLGHAAATGYLSCWFCLLGLNHSCLPEHNLTTALDFELRAQGLDSSSHMIDDNSLLLRCMIIEWCRPPLKSLKTERETVLSRWESRTIINHCLLSREHVSRLVIFHLEVTIGRSTNVTRTMIVLCVSLWFTVRNVEILNEIMVTSELKMRLGGMAAMGS
jgi:hypothetical protein